MNTYDGPDKSTVFPYTQQALHRVPPGHWVRDLCEDAIAKYIEWLNLHEPELHFTRATIIDPDEDKVPIVIVASDWGTLGHRVSLVVNPIPEEGPEVLDIICLGNVTDDKATREADLILASADGEIGPIWQEGRLR